MIIFKAIMFICSLISLYKAITEDDTGKAYNHLFDATITMLPVILIKPV